jgi:hypothetical protein
MCVLVAEIELEAATDAFDAASGSPLEAEHCTRGISQRAKAGYVIGAKGAYPLPSPRGSRPVGIPVPCNAFDLAAMQADILQCPVIERTQARNRSSHIPFSAHPRPKPPIGEVRVVDAIVWSVAVSSKSGRLLRTK